MGCLSLFLILYIVVMVGINLFDFKIMYRVVYFNKVL